MSCSPDGDILLSQNRWQYVGYSVSPKEHWSSASNDVNPYSRSARTKQTGTEKNVPFRRADAHSGGPKLDRLNSVLDLEQTPLRREGVHTPVILAASEEHCGDGGLTRQQQQDKCAVC